MQDETNYIWSNIWLRTFANTSLFRKRLAMTNTARYPYQFCREIADDLQMEQTFKLIREELMFYIKEQME